MRRPSKTRRHDKRSRKRATHLALLGALVSAFNLACGSAVIHDQYFGEPLLRISGSFSSHDEPVGTNSLRTSVFWSPSGSLSVEDIGQMHEDNSVQVRVEFPTKFEATVYKPPRPEWMVQGKNYAAGAIFVYEDTRGLGRFVEGVTPLRGGARATALFYSVQEVPREASPFDTAIGPGLMQLSLPLPCGGVEFAQEPDASAPACGEFPLGDPCTQDQDCGASGTCLRVWEDVLMSNGYCSAQIERACHHEGGVIAQMHEELSEQGSKRKRYLLKACQSSADCRSDEGYGCESFLHACLPARPTVIEFSESFQMAPLCLPEDLGLE